MKHILTAGLLSASMISMVSCSSFTDVEPKGANLLSTTSELELLLNSEEYEFTTTDMTNVAGDLIYCTENVSNLLSSPNKTLNSILISWDEAGHDSDMASLTASDYTYSTCYAVIGKIANPILSRVDAASGSEADKNQLRCEALTLRAYYHYLAVQKFAKAYDPDTAEETPAIAYMTEESDILSPAEQLSLKEVYEHILADVNEAIELDGLPVEAANRMRMCKACPYAVKALALIAMHDEEGAEAAAKQALAISSDIDDYNSLLTTTKGYILGLDHVVVNRPLLQCKEDYFTTRYLLFFTVLTAECQARFEAGHISNEALSTDFTMYDNLMGLGASYLGISQPLAYDLSSSWNNVGLKSTLMYLIVAEAEIEKGNISEAMDYLDKIRVNRIFSDQYTPLKGTVTDRATAIAKLKQTSHGENAYTMYNFIQRKRWNTMADYKETLTRTLNGTTYTLTPESSLWVFPFPSDVMSSNPNFKQNY